MPPAVDRKACGAEDVHPLIERRLPGEPADRQQQISKKDQDRAAPAGGFDRDLTGAQAASFLST